MIIENKIPKIIHYVWVGGKEKPNKIKKCIDSWKKKLPDYEIKEWNEKNFNINLNDYVKSAYKEKKWAFVSDYIRMYVIYNEGGIYFDTDVIAIDNLDEYLKYDCFVGYESNKMPFTAVFGARKNHPFIGEVLKMYELAEKKFDASSTNTILVSNILINNYGCKLGNKKQLLEDNILVLPKEILCNPSLKSKTIHAFTASWNIDKKISLIGRLEIWLRGKMFSKSKILIYVMLNVVLFTPKRFLGKIIKNRR